jgi:hypothetical protein
MFNPTPRDEQIAILVAVLTRKPANDVPQTITLQDGRTFVGSALEIVGAMRALCFVDSSSLRDYIDWLVGNTWRWEGVTLGVTGDTDAERAASVVDELLQAGLAQRGDVYTVTKRSRTGGAHGLFPRPTTPKR